MTIIAHCESCDRGFSRDLDFCPWCGANAAFDSYRHETVVRTGDTECYSNYWLLRVDPPPDGHDGIYELYEGHPLDREAMTKMLSTSTLVTFNGNHYDMPMITAALAGATNAQLKQASDEIIMHNLKPWMFYERWNLQAPMWDTIDMINVAPGKSSLKEYGGKLHSRKIQDLPIEPSAWITPEQRPLLVDYCGNDLKTTWDLYNTFPSQLKLREDMGAEYGLDLRSKSDPQISEAIMKKLTGVKYRVEVQSGTRFMYRTPPWIKFQNLKVLDLLARSPFTVIPNGGVEMTAELAKHHIIVGNTKYHMGIGGLHSTESGVAHVADSEYSLQDIDASSYYPWLILRTGIVPPAIGPQFVPIYDGWFNQRLAAKKAGNKKDADSRKTGLNGAFGKLGEMWSIFYAPSEMIQVTITGQLALLMLIEMLELFGIRVVSANTDGIVIKCRRNMEWMRDQIIAWWRAETRFETESVNYRAICMRDVNSYIALSEDTTKPPKLKGCYARPVPIGTSWPNPSGEISIDALCDYFTKGVPFETTIRACTDIRKFVHIRRVKGGAVWKSDFLGKVARWYYATGDTAEITYKTNGNKVPSSEGCRPLMELPDVFPSDVDHDRYLADTRAMFADLGVQL